MASIAAAIIPAAINAGGSLATAAILKPSQPRQPVQQPGIAQSLGLGQIPTWGLVLGGLALIALLMALTSRR